MSIKGNIATSTYRYKRPPRKRKPVAVEVPTIITASKPRQPGAERPTTAKASAIVTARKPGKRYSTAPEITPEEHQRRGDGADAMFREFKRLIAEKTRT